MIGTPETPWQPCYADVELGAASFDGIRIEADSIHDPRTDRVLPVMEEEQIFMCRQMRSLLEQRPGALVLDVGTGSGVFAIWAAKLGCRVVALDISPRALGMARENATHNGVAVVRDAEALTPGCICLLHRTFDAAYLRQQRARYDFAFLAPPYNPTCPGVFPALHASAGEDGQQAFREQVQLVPGVLRNGGICIGNQMCLADHGELTAIGDLRSAFGPNCRVRYARVIPDDYPARRFLEEQYTAYLAGGRHPGASVVRSYIERVGTEGRSFALIYYEVQQGRSGLTEELSEEALPAARPAVDWARRVLLHKWIVDNTTPAASPPMRTEPSRSRTGVAGGSNAQELRAALADPAALLGRTDVLPSGPNRGLRESGRAPSNKPIAATGPAEPRGRAETADTNAEWAS